MTVRTATPDDTPKIRRIAEDSWEADYPDILSSESLEAGLDEWYGPERIRESIDRSHARTLVAERNDEVAGFVHAIWDVEKDEGDILRLYVHPEHRGEELGTALLEAACRDLFETGADRIRAMVLEANEVGNEFYSTFGFEHVDTTEVSIGDEMYRENTYELQPEAMPDSG